MKPLISVLMAVYNGGRHLGDAIESILSQDFRDFEFLIVDDASTDDTRDLLRFHAGRDARIRLLLNDRNKGQTACLNEGLREASGVWIARQDADDISLPGRLSSQWLEITRHSSDLVLTGVNGWVIDSSDTITGTLNVPVGDDGIRWSMRFQNPMIHSGVMFRRILPGGMPALYDESFRICQDWELWGRMTTFGSCSNLRERLIAYRHLGDSLSHREGERTLAEIRAIKGSLPAELPAKGMPLDLLTLYRAGLSGSDRWTFWNRYGSEWGALDSRPTRGQRQARSLHHLQAASSKREGNPMAMIWEMIRALQFSPGTTLAAIYDRFRVGSIMKYHQFSANVATPAIILPSLNKDPNRP